MCAREPGMGGTNCLPSRGRGLFICTLVKGSRHKYTTTEVNRDRGKQERKHKVKLGGDMWLHEECDIGQPSVGRQCLGDLRACQWAAGA